jgi:ribose transport system substrate-binding protein
MDVDSTVDAGLDRRTLLKVGGASAVLLGASSVLGTPFAEAANHKNAALQSRKKVTCVIHDLNPFFVPLERGFREFGKFMDWSVNYVGPTGQDIQKTVELQAAAIASRPDGVIFTRIDDKAFDANIKLAQRRGIKVVLTNVGSKGYEDLSVPFVGQDFVPAGKIAGLQGAEYAKKKTGKNSGVILVGNFAPGNSALEDRAAGAKLGVTEYNSKNGTSYTTEILVTSSDEAKATGIIEARLAKGDVVGYIGTEFSHQFFGNVMRRRNLKLSNGGFDLVQPVLQGIKAGNIDFTLDQNPWAQGWVASSLLAMEMSPGFKSFSYDTGSAVIDAKNINAIIKREAVFA